MNPILKPAVTAYIGLGANLGPASETVRQALQDLGAIPNTELKQCSALYCTAPLDSQGPDYINAVAEISTRLAPLELLTALQKLETQAGRSRPYRNAPRTLDLDLLLYGELTIDSPTLVLPHPRMLQRAFVLLPLAQIAPQRVSMAQLQAVADQVIERIEP